MRRADLEALNRARAARETVAVVTPLDGGPGRLVRRETLESDPLGEAIAARIASGKSGRVDSNGGEVFVRVHRPSPRLTVVGAVHVSQALVPMAETAGFEVTIVDPRTAFATEERFAGMNLVAEWPEPEVLRLDRETAVATLTHDPKIDDPAIVAALEAGCFYVGALGSRKTHARRVERLRAAGLSDDLVGRIHAPIGLPIGAAAPAEIAVAVLAEIIQVLRTGARPAAVSDAAARTPVAAA